VYIPDFEGLERVRRAAERRGTEKKDGDKKEPPPPEDKKDQPKKESLSEKEPAPLTPNRNADSPQPFVYWAYKFPDEVTDAPAIFSEEQISMLTSTGTLVSVNRYGEGPRKENFEFQVKGNTPGGGAQHGDMIYFGSSDFNLYALRMKLKGNLVWRHIAGAPILRRPDVNDRDIFIAPDRLGLRKLDRMSGREAWTNRDVAKFLAANQSFVYALDRLGNFFVLDAKRGTTLAKLDLTEWAISVANEYTDRIYLAANDGQVLCLRHRDLAKPLIMKAVPEYKHWDDPAKEGEKKKEEKKDDGKDKGALQLDRLPAAALLSFRLDAPTQRTWALR
jgi:hypothetical protein